MTYSIGDTLHPIYEATYYLDSDCSDIVDYYDLLLLACGQAGLLVFDINDRLQPDSLTGFNTDGSVYRITVSDTLAYLADGTAGLTAVSLADPRSPYLVQTLNTPGSTLGSAVYGDYVIAADRDSLFVVATNEDTGIDEISGGLPMGTCLIDCYPNPFNSEVSISFEIENPGQISLDIFDINGRFVENLAAGYFNSGPHNVRWNATGRATGVYMLKLSSTQENSVLVGSAKILYLK